MAAAASQFKTIVEQAMRDGDLSLSEAARRSGIERRRWYTYFTGEHAPGRVTLAKMARGLGVDYDVLAGPWGDLGIGPGIVTDPGPSRLYELLEGQTRAFNRLAAAIERMVERPIVVPDELVESMRRSVEEAEREARDTTSPPQPADPHPIGGIPRRASPETTRPGPGRSQDTRP